MMMSSRLLGSIAVASLIAGSLSGCAPPEIITCDPILPAAPQGEVKGGVVLIFQASQDFPDAQSSIRQNSELFSFLPSNRESTPVTYAAIVADGAPAPIFQGWVKDKLGAFDSDIERQSERALGILAKEYTCTFENLDSANNLRENVNIVAALDQASKLLSNVTGKREIHVLSNGFQTAGQPNFSQDFPENNSVADGIIDSLQAASALPNLNGVEVKWKGLGQSTTSAEAISLQAKNVLQYFWAELIERSGAAGPTEFSTAVLSGNAPERATPSLPLAEFAELCLFRLGPSSGFSFIPDTADFINFDNAQKGAAEIAEEILDSGCGGVRLSVTGYTASGTSKSNFDARPKGPDLVLSSDRAEAFAALLRAEGLQVAEVIGGGKGRFNDWDDSGNFVPKLGEQNRIVKIEEVR